MSQAFVNLGSKVTVIDKADRIMQNMTQISEILQQSLIDQNVEFKLGCSINKIRILEKIEILIERDETEVISGSQG